MMDVTCIAAEGLMQGEFIPVPDVPLWMPNPLHLLALYQLSESDEKYFCGRRGLYVLN